MQQPNPQNKYHHVIAVRVSNYLHPYIIQKAVGLEQGFVRYSLTGFKWQVSQKIQNFLGRCGDKMLVFAPPKLP